MKNEILTKEEVEDVARMLSKNDLNLTTAQVIAQIKSQFPNATLPWRKKINDIISFQRTQSIRGEEGLKMIDVTAIQTLRKTSFGREIGFSLVDGKPKYYLYLYSDFQKQVANEVMKDPNLHLFVDGTFKCCPKMFSQLLNVWVYHREKKLYIPICHVLMQTQKYEGYLYALKRIKDIFHINPHFVTVDFEVSEISAVKEVFPESSLVPWFFHFVKCLWMNAQKWGLRKKKFVAETKQLIFSLKALAFRHPTKVYSRFQKLKNEYMIRGVSFKSFLEYFDTIWMDGTFQIKDWNYHDKLSEFEDLAITNNGLESFHQIIKSQLRRITPSFSGFIEVISRAETLKKADYDEDRVNGDPQYNRCWPVTKIFKELYVKEFKKSENNKEDESFTDYGVVKLQELKKENVNEFTSKSKQIEREVQFLFEEFDEDNWNLEQDSRIRERNKVLKELSVEQANSTIPSEQSFSNDYLLQWRPQLSNQVESIKKSYFTTKKSKPKYNNSALEEVDEDLIKILKGDFQVQSLAFLPKANSLDISSRNQK